MGLMPIYQKVNACCPATHAEHETYLKKARQLGASGFIAKEDAQSKLLSAIAMPANGFCISELVGRQGPLALADGDFVEHLKSVWEAD